MPQVFFLALTGVLVSSSCWAGISLKNVTPQNVTEHPITVMCTNEDNFLRFEVSYSGDEEGVKAGLVGATLRFFESSEVLKAQAPIRGEEASGSVLYRFWIRDTEAESVQFDVVRGFEDAPSAFIWRIDIPLFAERCEVPE